MSWHSDRHFPTVHHSLRHRVLRSVCKGNIDTLDECLEAGWPIDDTIDKQGKYSALTLACHLDNLEMAHFCDMNGANLSAGAGKFKNTPLMTAT